MKKQIAPKPEDKQANAETTAVQPLVIPPIDPSKKGGTTKNNDGGYIWLVS